MKRLMLILLLAITLVIGLSPEDRADYLGMNATTDTLSIPIYIEDSLGNPVLMTASDSVYITVTSPSNTVVYSDSTLGNGAKIGVHDWEDIPDHYVYTELVGTLDGAATTYGTYTVHVTAADVSLDLLTDKKHTFQKISANLDVLLARLDAAITTRSTLSATDNIGINWADITNVATTWDFTNTTFGIATSVGTVTGNVNGSVGSVTGAVGSVTGNVGGNVVGSVASVSGSVGSVTGYVGGITGTKNTLDDLNDLAETANIGINWNDITNATATQTFANTTFGTVTSVGTVTGNVGGIAGTKNQLDDLNDIAATDVVSSGAITTSSGAVVTVTGVTNTVTADVESVQNDAINLLTDVTNQLPDSNVATITVILDVTGLDNDSSFTNLQAEAYQTFLWATDSLLTMMGFPGSTLLPWSEQLWSANADTTLIGIGNDTIAGIIYHHSGGSPGDDPTNTETFLW